MCGIAGIFAYKSSSPPVEEEELLRCREAMVTRGPDGSGIWISRNNRVGLAHRRLSIIDLSTAGTQPMATKDGLLRVVFNGEIYNYRALRHTLEKKGYRFRSNCDTEVLLHLYVDRGTEMVHDLRGMYAFALWDERKRGLLLARDPFGIKPLYYFDDGSTIRFASQVKALLRAGRLDTSPHPAGHVGFFLWGYVPEPYTLYKKINALPAGSTLWRDETGRHNLNNFCNIPSELTKASKSDRKIGHQEAQEHLTATLTHSVRHHLVADVPIGVFLSSGLDSTTLLALAAKVIPSSRLTTITLGLQEYQDTINDETPLAAKVAGLYGTSHQEKWISREDFWSELSHLLAAMDQPSIDGVNTYFIGKVASEAGLKVTLSGLGGDELFGSYPSFRHVPSMARMLSAARVAPGLGRVFRFVSASVLKHFTSPKYAGLLEYGSSYGGAYLLRRGLFMPWELPEVLDGKMVQEGWKELQPLLRLEETIRGIRTDHLRVSALEMVWFMRNQLLRDVDWAGMAHSLEIRVPFVDIELLRSVAPMLGSSTSPTKLDMARFSAKRLPDEVLYQRKIGFNVPVREWLIQGRAGGDMERGLRGWAREVYSTF